MMILKRVFCIGIFMIFCANLFAQEYFVPTHVSKRKAVMEEFTGVLCSNCPDGHKRSDQLKERYQDQYIAINIHQGSFAGGTVDYKTPFGDSIANQSGLVGYPMATVNRTVFKGNTTALMRDDWVKSVDAIVKQDACVNLAAKSFLDWESGELVCIVQGYYTSDSRENINYLNLAMVQNNIIGPQQGAAAYPEMIVAGDSYRHNHMLRHVLTGQWGLPITNTKSGSYFSDTIRYTLPTDYRSVVLNKGEIELFAFVTETHQNILNACESSIEYENLSSNPRLLSAKQAQIQNCEGLGSIEVKIQNLGEGRINTMSFEYTYNNETYQCTWDNGHIMPDKVDTMVLCHFPLTDDVNEVSVRITAVNGEKVSESIPIDSLKTTVQMDKRVGRSAMTAVIKLVLDLDQYGSEVSWRILDGQGLVIAEKQYMENLGSEGTKTYNESVEISNSDCYLFEIFDKGKDGINSVYGKGSYKIYDEKDKLLAQSDGKYGAKDYQILSLGSISNEDEMSLQKNRMRVYPNPTQGQGQCHIEVEKTDRIRLTLYDLSGRRIRLLTDKIYTNGTHEIAFDFSELSPALYLLFMYSREGVQTQKINIIK